MFLIFSHEDFMFGPIRADFPFLDNPDPFFFTPRYPLRRRVTAPVAMPLRHEAKQYDVFITVFRHFDVDGNGHLEACLLTTHGGVL